MDAKQRAVSRFEAVEDELKQISRWMYQNPEVAYEERESSRRLAGFLEAQGFTVEYPAFGLETAFAARAGSSGPEVIVCAEYDALPGVGHACGHNIIATSALGAGVAVKDLAEELGFRITVLGTPAEEAKGGKVDLIHAGAFADAAAALMIHPAPEDEVDPVALAIKHFKVIFRGKDAHASAAPWEGINALDAFVQLYVNVSTFRQQMLPTDKMHGIVTHGGDAPNIIPSRVEAEWYVRALTKERLAVLVDRFEAMAGAAAASTGCTVEYSQSGHEYEDILSEPLMVELFAANSEALGRKMGRSKDRPSSTAGSTDMGNVSHVVPSIHPMIGMATGGAVNHQPEFAAHTITPDGEKAMRDGALAMAWTIVDLAAGDRWGELSRP
ncbi:MAG: M20 family metallopeptidase [Acidimicrobiia bacterium]|nr:MAG: M20 family metallopeptidase [Acidimicrobiia bacterium]